MDINQPPAITQPYPTEHGSSRAWTTGSISFAPTGPTYLTIAGTKGEMVRISMQDGSITFGPDYQPDEAARIFWRAVSDEYRRYLAWKADHPKE